MSTVFVFAPALEHDWPRHPENAQRPRAIYSLLRQEGVLADLLTLDPKLATHAQLLRVHHPSLIDRVMGVSLRGGGRLDADTYATAESFEMASLAAGSACRAVDAILTGEAKNGFVVARPPGHHAEIENVGGFCLFNNVAIAARHAQQVHGLKRVMIFDFDVHHGNGTQDIFFADDSVLFISTHLFGSFFYPGTGDLFEVGVRMGEGLTLNVPLPSGVGDVGYKMIFEQVIAPRARQFKPELILVSAGYDAHWQDPLAMAALSLRGYAEMSQAIVGLADEICDGRVLFILEGGYLLEALSHGVLNSLYALLGRDKVKDPLGPFPHAEADIRQLVSTVQQRHLIK